MFYGQKEATIDEKGRMTLPSLYRDEFVGQLCFVSYGLDGCIELYPKAVYERIAECFGNNPLEFDEKARKVKRTFFRLSSEVQIDSHNRILIPKVLLEKTKTGKKVLILGNGESLQIWDANKYVEISEAEEESFAEDAQSLIQQKNG